jgi:hypothetical protein
MNSLLLTLRDAQSAYLPGETLRCTLSWDLEHEPEDLRVNLLWFTEGKGTTDSAIVAETPLPGPGTRGERDLSFQLPSAPLSFSGQLVSLRWALEAVTRKPKVHHNVAFVLSATGGEILLGEPLEGDNVKIPKGCISFTQNRRA